MRAYIVVDLGFGDCGKGLLTDFLVRHVGAGLVVRYNGGAQAGHNVVAPDGRQHTFSQFGSGTFVPGVCTYLSRDVVIHPTALLAEGDALVGKGLPDPFARLRISDQALVITPFHQAINRMREIARGADRHGSCGVGVGEAVEDAILQTDDRILAGDLGNPALLRRKLSAVRERKRADVLVLCEECPPGPLLAREREIFEREDVIEAWISSVARIGDLGLVTPDTTLERWLRETDNVVFEGAQGVLLDADAGFHPFTTWSRCTTANALDLIAQAAPQGADVHKIGVMRCYAARHGPGPLPTETRELASVISEHNQANPWQGAVRYGWFDAVLARYALAVTGGVDALKVTHLDALPHLETWKYCPGYRAQSAIDEAFVDPRASGGLLTGFSPPDPRSLGQRERFTQALSAAMPLLESCEVEAGKVVQKIEALLGQPVNLVSRGPCATDVQVLNDLPR